MTPATAAYFYGYASVCGIDAATAYVAEMAPNIRQLADIIERADEYHPDFIVRAIIAMSAAQLKIDELQSPAFGPN